TGMKRRDQSENEPTRLNGVSRSILGARVATVLRLPMSNRRTFAKIGGLTPSRPIPVEVKPTEADVEIAQGIAHHTSPVPEEIGRALAWGADEKLLLVLAAIGWMASRGGGERLRRAGNHALLVTVASSLIPHCMKLIFDRVPTEEQCWGMSMAFRSLASATMLFPPAMPSIWARWPPQLAPCRPGRGERSERLPWAFPSRGSRSWRIGRRMCLPGSRSAWFWSDSFGNGRGT